VVDRRFLHSEYSAYLCRLERTDERTRTADLLITSDRSAVAGVCSGLQIPHIYAVFLSLICSVLHRIAVQPTRRRIRRARPGYQQPLLLLSRS
jgi:hypothetical protein